MSPALHPVLAKLPAPHCRFTSDNSAAAHPILARKAHVDCASGFVNV
ncbi:hypothetical protein [Undibacterium sp.]|nr:hypothetical protein [Undibacterium sp.]